MNDSAIIPRPAPSKTEHVDVLIVGACISGVVAGYRFQKQCSATSFVALECQESFPGERD